MAKAPKTNNAPVVPVSFELPEGYVEQSDDIIGVLNPDIAPAHFVPLNAALSDSKLDANKPSMLVFGTLMTDSTVYAKDETGESIPVQAKAGDRVGLWTKAGMAKLRDLAGVPVFIALKGEKKTGKPNPMKVYVIASPKVGTPLQIVADRRVKSAGTKTFLSRDDDATFNPENFPESDSNGAAA